MAKRKTKSGAKLDAELTRFLIILSFDEEMRARYKQDPDGVVDDWPEPLTEAEKVALKSGKSDILRTALISQQGFIARRGKPAGRKKAAKGKNRTGGKKKR